MSIKHGIEISKEDVLALVAIAKSFLIVALGPEAQRVISEFIDEGNPLCGYNRAGDYYWINLINAKNDTLFGIAGSMPTMRLSHRLFQALKPTVT
jgi:hypothetical protein